MSDGSGAPGRVRVVTIEASCSSGHFVTDRFADSKRRFAPHCPAAAETPRTNSAVQKWQPNREHGAGAGGAIYLDRAAVVFDYLLGDIKTETSATLVLLGGKVGIENLADLPRIDA